MTSDPSKSLSIIESDLPISAQRTPGGADRIFDVTDDRFQADFPESLDNTFWVYNNKSLYCGGKLCCHPEFTMSGFSWGGSPALRPRYVQSSLYGLHTSTKQALKLKNLCISMSDDCHVGYFLKINLDGKRTTNIGVVVEKCFLKGINIETARINAIDPVILCQTQFYHNYGGSYIYYADDSIYDDPDPLVQHFIKFNALHINCRRSRSKKLESQPFALEHKP